MNLDLSILVVTYNCESFLERFHQELVNSLECHENWELHYHDNSQNNNTWALLQKLCENHCSVSRNTSNPGFAFGINRLVTRSKKKRLLLLNPDVFGFQEDFWYRLLEHEPDNGALFIRLQNEDGNMQDCVGRISSLRRAFKPRPDYSSLSEPVEVETGIMAFMLVRREIFKKVGPLDESFKLYAEDMDWCYRAKQIGVPLIFNPSLSLTHIGGASADTEADKASQKLRKLVAERIFIDKHYSGSHRYLMIGLNALKRTKARL